MTTILHGEPETQQLLRGRNYRRESEIVVDVALYDAILSVMNTAKTTINRLDDETSECDHHHSASYDADKARIQARLRRIEGQVRGVHKMVEEDKYCVDVLTQISAIVAGLRATGLVILEDHIRGCVLDADPYEQEAVLDELMGAIERFNRSIG